MTTAPAHSSGGKYPIWLRLAIIVSLSAALWAGILSGISALMGG